MGRNYDPSKARRHWQYSREELAILFDVTVGSLPNWRKRGLKAIDDERPQIFSGQEVRRFLTEWKFGNRSEPKEGKPFCINCCGYNPLVLGSIIHKPDALRCAELSGHCTKCDAPISLFANSWRLSEIYMAASKFAADSSAEGGGPVSREFDGLTTYIRPEKNKLNLRVIYEFQIYLLNHEGVEPKTVDEYLRSLAKMSFVTQCKLFKDYKVDDARAVKAALRAIGPDSERPLLALTTIDRALTHCKTFFEWLIRQDKTRLPRDLPGYFSLSRKEKRIASDAVKGTEFSFEQALQILRVMPSKSSKEVRDRAIIALLIMTGIRIKALTTLRGKHVNIDTFWVYQKPPEVETKGSKSIRSYCLPISIEAREALREWADLRREMGFADNDAFFLPDCNLGPNALGLSHRVADTQTAECWRSTDPVNKIVRTAADLAGFVDVAIGAHDFRKAIHPYLAKNSEMDIKQQNALERNFGHSIKKTIEKNYFSLSDSERQECLDELCRAALGRNNSALVLAFEKGEIPVDDPDYYRAEDLHRKAASTVKRLKLKISVE